MKITISNKFVAYVLLLALTVAVLITLTEFLKANVGEVYSWETWLIAHSFYFAGSIVGALFLILETPRR